MNGNEFVSLAIKLSNSQHEAELRTAVSRAYYGAFHSARELIVDCGIAFPRKDLLGSDIHRKVRFCLANAGHPDAISIANNLDSLRRQRNLADYDLATGKFTALHVRQVRTTLDIAIEIVDALQRCRTADTFSQFRQSVRGYAHDVLRLPLGGA
jgi:uncharacterized protein (UPF0332 family)